MFKYPHIFFIILFCLISFLPQPLQERYWVDIRIFFVIFLIILVLNKKYRKNLLAFQDWPLWVFLICLLAGVVGAMDKRVALKTYLYLATTLALLFYIGKGIFHYNMDRNVVVKVICSCGCLVALIGILELYFKKNILYANLIANPFYVRYVFFSPRPMSTQFNPVILGSYLLCCLPFCFFCLKNKSLYWRLIGIFSSALFIIVILLTYSRGVFLGLVALLSFYLWKRRRSKLLIYFSFCVVLFIIICSYQKNSNLFRFGFKRMIAGSHDSSISGYRLTRIKMSVRMLKDYSLFGIGFNHFRIRFNDYYEKKDKNVPYEFMIPDNMYLTFLAETGIIGTGSFLIFIFFLLKRGLLYLRKTDDDRKQILLMPLSALIGLLVNMAAYDLFYWANPYMLFCVICGFIQGTLKENRR